VLFFPPVPSGKKNSQECEGSRCGTLSNEGVFLMEKRVRAQSPFRSAAMVPETAVAGDFRLVGAVPRILGAGSHIRKSHSGRDLTRVWSLVGTR